MEQAMFPQNENNTPFDNEALFDAEGHLTDEGLHALQESRLDELGSLEAAEHLTFCDYCLARYTALIESAPEKLKQPMRDLIPQVQALMRLRSFRIMTNRYVSAAAAVVLGFVMWGAVSTFGVPNPAALLPQQPAARQEPSVSRCRPPCGGGRTATAPGRTPLPGKSASTKEWTLPVRKARRCWLSGKELPRLPDAATVMASACSCCTRTAPRPFMRTCNTCMCVPVKRYRPGRYWARQGRPAVPPGHTCTLSCADRGPPATRRPCWDCRMHRRTPLRMDPLRFRDPVLLCGVLYGLLLFDASGFLRTGLLAAFLHEWGHILVYCAQQRRFPVIEVTLTGFCMRLGRAELSPAQRFRLAAAGPAVNFALAGVWAVLLSRQATVRGSAFWAANLLTGAFNLLPVPPLDGAQMLASAAQLRAQKKSARNDCKNLHFRVK